MENKTAPLSTIEEPEPKKQKMSTTTSDDEEAATAAVAGDGPAPERKPRYKRRKIAIFFAYCGVGYQGMQKNPGAKTIEGDLEEALYQAGGVPEHDKCQPRRYDWARSARTDKGVSAVGQVVSGRFYVDPPGFIDRLNSILSPQIRIFGFKRVTNAFNAKKFCDRRRYVYFVPVFALDPSSHRDRETVLASVGSGKELVKCLECSERGRKVFGVMGKRVYDPITKSVIVVAEPGNMPNNGDAQVTLQNIESNVNVNANDVITESNMVIENGASLSEKGEETKEEVEKGDENAKAIEEQVEESVFSYGEKEKERFNRILKYYEGTHNFHNFTTRTKADDPAAKRYIISFTANTIVNVEGIEFVKCEVVGQSFMLHQIRKMIGLAVAIMRNCAPESLIQTAFRRDVNINVPMAPEVGLYLDECFFTSYNSKWKDTHEEVSLKAYTEAAEEFKMKYIYSHIASTEHKDGTMALWLHSLNYRNYPDLRGVDNDNSAGASDGSKAIEAVVEAGIGAVKNGESTDNVNSAGAVDDSKAGEAVVEAGLGAVNDGESTDNVNIAGAGDGSEVETVIEVGLSAVDNGESADAKDADSGGDADLVTS
ncbi:uncharacterized protein [Nicotiana sylvestris]|uniref:tRNA pseudouridine synthase A, mitochondrial n=1 Tax=Nicotiana sylvestris TaxID=4096 RepID=A0A1U7WDP0_NICSY|nr:PREDICTED: tRNA pseudouridine synthase A, mitochondrial [Nicotiana sylvestris]